MKVMRVDVAAETLLKPNHAVWDYVSGQSFPLVPTPLNGNPGIKKISPFIEKSTDHGTITEVTAAAVHNGLDIAIRLSWASGKHDKIVDLDEFVDGAAVMFPLTDKASAITMGSASDPVNAWYWKANRESRAFDVVARGYGTSGRSSSDKYPIMSASLHTDGRWHLVLTRSLVSTAERARFAPGVDARMAFAVWDGGNRERSGRKSFSGDFVPVPVEP
ncbi:MAG: ethylbenzene dehydrogenase-related protein [Gammaproteobacteria bacterium]|jgi:DMSO reductase family type II enzyme heme b subunit